MECYFKRISARDRNMNGITPTDNEAQITFGYVFMAFIVCIYNLRISFPNEEILLAFMDIKDFIVDNIHIW